ncbi:MAG: YicC family protein [Clostridiales bacterium]|nr:YicC family protein [Clostridiales bacterium]MCF8022725.1 YicC family protein [Clostridiales bacterium]
MIKSMTGFGRGESFGLGKKFTVELKSVNHRFCELFFKLPKSMNFLEERCKRLSKDYISRGRVEGFFTVEDYEERPVTVKVDKTLAESYYKAMKELKDSLQLTEMPSIQDIINFPGVLVAEELNEDVEEWWVFVEQALSQALSDLVKMREVEGEKLYQDLIDRINNIYSYNKEIEQRAPQVIEEYHGRMQNRLQEWSDSSNFDEDRLYSEVVIFAERSNITEETVRLDSHFNQMFECIKSNEPVGRKMDFLAQEVNREINTIASKANDAVIGKLVVEVKSELEKIREQIQNVE